MKPLKHPFEHLMRMLISLERRIARLEEDLAGAAPLEEVRSVGSVSWRKFLGKGDKKVKILAP